MTRHTSERHRDAMLAVALDAVARGWYVFPLRPHSKKPPAFHGEDHCPATGICATTHQGWEQRATNDPREVRWYWESRRYGGCNVGIATGRSGLLIVDLDTADSPDDRPQDGSRRGEVQGGLDMLVLLCEEAGQPIPMDTLTVETPSGGWHLYFRAPAGVRLGNTQGNRGLALGWKIDTRGQGGYVVAPGSTTPDGPYRLADDRPVADLPAWLVQRLTVRPPTATTAPVQIAVDRLPAYVEAALRGEADRVARAQTTAHNIVLYTAAVALGQLVAGGLLPSSRAEETLYAAATHMITGDCGCTDREVRRVIDRGIQAGRDKPRTAPARRGAA
ncbi:bifunctional DNA primase/polymerase [Saccharothrix deserti]|uniref:bifunctional DNA primase/polymerase n=1 Tax=Saccharothrix deserti TaxID=2593674 RepID=UPI001EE3C498|nr:bifunctional DNA primase/polymerase [Saccharothrix deserti]